MQAVERPSPPTDFPPPSESLPVWIWGLVGLIPLALLFAVVWVISRSVLLTLFVIFIITLVPSLIAMQIALAKSRAIRNRQNELSLLGGLVKLVLWEANEGLVFLKNKRIHRLVYGPRDGGGTRLIYPIVGEELKVRVPLTLKLTQFQDDKVMTRESTQLFIKVAFWWRVADLERYYYSVDKEVHKATSEFDVEAIDMPGGPSQRTQQGAAEAWMLTLAESCIRKLVSQSTTALLVSKAATSYLRVDEKYRSQEDDTVEGVADPSESWANAEASTPDAIAGEIHKMLAPKAADYGLEIDRVEIQEVRLPEGIQRELDEVFKATLKPARSEQEALAEQIRLQTIAKVLGVETVRLQEVLKQFRGSQYIGGFPKIFEALFAKAAAPSDTPALIGKTSATHLIPEGADSPDSTAQFKCPSCGATDAKQDGDMVDCRVCGASFPIGKRPGEARSKKGRTPRQKNDPQAS